MRLKKPTETPTAVPQPAGVSLLPEAVELIPADAPGLARRPEPAVIEVPAPAVATAVPTLIDEFPDWLQGGQGEAVVAPTFEVPLPETEAPAPIPAPEAPPALTVAEAPAPSSEARAEVEPQISVPVESVPEAVGEAPAAPGLEPAAELVSVAAEAAAQPADLVESVQQVVSEMKSMAAVKDVFDRKAAGKLLTAVEIAQMEGQDRTLVETRLQELKQDISGLLAKIHSKTAVRDLQEKQKSGLLLTAVEIATIKTAESIGDEEYAKLKRLRQELETFSALVPEKPQDEIGEIGEPPMAPEDPVAQIRRKQAEGTLLTQWELAQLRLADEAKTSSPEAVTVAETSVLSEEGAPAEMSEPPEAEATPEVIAAPELPVIEVAEEPPVPVTTETPVPSSVDEFPADLPLSPAFEDEEGAVVPANQAVIDGVSYIGGGGLRPGEVLREELVHTSFEPMPKAAEEMSKQKFERRKQGFAGALAELDKARNDTSGTEGEQKVRLAEAYNQAIGSAMEFMEEGEAAKEVVKGFFAGALGTPGGRKLTEIAVRSRMDETGVTGAPTGEKKKKLEQAGLLGLLELLLELGMNFTDKTIGAVITEVQSATGGGK